MKTRRLLIPVLKGLLCLAILGAAGCGGPKAGINDYQSLKKAFSDPPAEYLSVPFWVWNDRMTREEIEIQLADFRDRGIGGVFIHPRPGLITPYLSEEWLALCRFAVETGKSLGMNIWLYDENSYPSGFAGGHVPAELPDSVRTGLKMTKHATIPEGFEPPPLAVLRRTLTGFDDVTDKLASLPDDGSSYYVFELAKQAPSPWYGGYTYVDLMRREVTEKFLEITLDAYKKAFGEEFGKAVPGVFQDEAEISPAGGRTAVNYTPSLFEAFEARWGYDLKTHLPSLFEEFGEWRRIRHNTYEVLLDLFIEGWAKPYYAYCTKHKLEFTGHYWEHEWPVPRICPDNLALAAYAHMPGIDILMNEWGTGPHAQFGNARAVREIRSAANQSGRRRTMSETYGAAGWDLTFFDQKRIGDWEYALGVNFMNQHLSYATIKGARKRDHPPSFSYHEPWWESYDLLAGYFGRLSVALSSGEQVNRVLVLEPTTSGWMHYSPGSPNEGLKRIGEDFQKFIHLLEAEQIEYDVASEKTIEESGAVKRGVFTVGRRDYDLLVFPPGLENLNGSTLELLKDYLFRGGHIVSWVAPPDYLDGAHTDAIRVLAGAYSDRWVNSGPGSGFGKIRSLSPPRLVFRNPEVQPSLFHQRRELGDCEIVFLANSSPDRPAGGRFAIAGGSVEVWDPFTGGMSPYPFERAGEGLEIGFSLPPAGSLLLCVLPQAAESLPVPEISRSEVTPNGEMRIERESPNVLTLDYCDLSLGGKTVKDLYFYEAQKKAFQFHGFDGNPWDGAVQFKSDILDKDVFPPESGFEAAFRFSASGAEGLSSLMAVVERPELFAVSINGTAVRPLSGEWWLDRGFGVFPIGASVREGENVVTVGARPFSVHAELEPVYILGDFGLSPAGRGFQVRPAGPITLGPWPAQGMPFYGAAVAYSRTFEMSREEKGSGRYCVELGEWRGAVSDVLVNGGVVGRIAFPPYELDITDSLGPGVNEISVRVFGTLKNTLGPHHNDPPLGRAWPGSFRQGAEGGPPPGSRYSVVPYGLLEEFKLIRITTK